VPNGGVWFYKKKDMYAYHVEHGGFLLAWDNGNGGAKLFGVYPSNLDFAKKLLENPPEKRWAYELIPLETPCRGYVDIDFKGGADTKHKRLMEYLGKLDDKIETEFGIKSKTLVLASSRPDKELLSHYYHQS